MTWLAQFGAPGLCCVQLTDDLIEAVRGVNNLSIGFFREVFVSHKGLPVFFVFLFGHINSHNFGCLNLGCPMVPQVFCSPCSGQFLILDKNLNF